MLNPFEHRQALVLDREPIGTFLSFALRCHSSHNAARSFYTLPIWIFSQLTRPRDRPVTNVVALFVIILTIIPILLAYRSTQENQSLEQPES